MISQRRNQLPAASAAGLCLLLAPIGLSNGPAPASWAPELPSRFSAPHTQALSCKVSSPILVSLEASAASGSWRIHLNASQSVAAIRVTLWATTPSGETPPRTVWQGDLRNGEARDLEVHAVLPADAQQVFAQAEIVNGGGAIERSLAESPGPAAKAQLAASPQRVTVNPQTGETVIEYDGHVGGAR